MKAYKGFYKDGDGRIYCSPKNNVKFYYEEGKTYETDKAKLCHYGFHACTIPMDVFWYYNSTCCEVEFHEVELEGVTDDRDNDSKVCGTKITIGRKISPDEMVELSIPMIMADKDKYFIDDKPYRIRNDYKYNFINKEGQIHSNEWFDWAALFKNGFSTVCIAGKWSFINTDGNYLTEQWFDNIDSFYDGFGRVKLGDKWSFINTDGNYIKDNLWFPFVSNFKKGFARVELNGKWNFIDTDGNILRDDLWFDNVWNFNEGFAMVCFDDKCFKINTKGEIIAES